MTKNIIALDAMGGDNGPSVVVPAALDTLSKNPHLHLILVGDETVLQSHLEKQAQTFSERISIHHASEVVTMDDLPSHALRSKKQSSMRIALNLVKEGKAQACVSAGNTGALMATARFVLKTLPGIDRPAIMSELPTRGNKTRVLDLGANVDSCAEHLFQFAVMGSVLVSAVDNIPNPTVGLLNIGAEEIKGNDQVKRTAQLLADAEMINYVGYVEGDDIFKGNVDLIVCDGFVGNVALKASEGVAKLVSSYIQQAFKKNCWSRLVGVIAFPILMGIKKQLNPSRYNGASLVGLNGIVVKSHGDADQLGFAKAIQEAISEVDSHVSERTGEQISHLLNAGLLT